MSEWKDIATAPRDGTHILTGVRINGEWLWRDDYWGERNWTSFLGKPPTHWAECPTPPPEELFDPEPCKIKRYPISTARRDRMSVVLWFKGYTRSVEGYYKNGKWIQTVNGCEVAIEPSYWSPIPVPVDEERKR